MEGANKFAVVIKLNTFPVSEMLSLKTYILLNFKSCAEAPSGNIKDKRVNPVARIVFSYLPKQLRQFERAGFLILDSIGWSHR